MQFEILSLQTFSVRKMRWLGTDLVCKNQKYQLAINAIVFDVIVKGYLLQQGTLMTKHLSEEWFDRFNYVSKATKYLHDIQTNCP